MSARGAVADTTSAELVQMMVGRRIDNLFPKTVAPIGAPVLEARDIVRRPMTKSVSLTVRAGEIVGLAGLVGSGRSEFAQTIFGITPAEFGRDPAHGRDRQDRLAGRARAPRASPTCPEDRGVQGLVRPMSVLHNLSLAALGSALAGSASSTAAAELRLAEEAVQRFSVKTSSVDEIAGRLSGGNQQKIVLGKWLANNPKLLILDEPTRGIDVGAKAEIHRLMSELAGTGVAILMISSELPEVLGMSDRVLVMREGRLVAEFDRARRHVRSGRRGDDGRGRRTWRRRRERDRGCRRGARARPAASGASPRRRRCSPSRSSASPSSSASSIRASSPTATSPTSCSATPISPSPRSACRW